MEGVKNTIGIGRLSFLFYSILFGVASFFLQALVVNVDGNTGPGATIVIIVLIFSFVSTLTLALERLKNIGASLWIVILMYVPVINIFFGLFLLLAPSKKILVKNIK